MGTPRMTGPTRDVLRVLLEAHPESCYGLEVVTRTGLPSGTVHPILARLEVSGWGASDWEQIDPAEHGRPRRRYYRLTPKGREAAVAALQRAEAERARRTRRDEPGWAT